MKPETTRRIRKFAYRSMVGYFGPLIALIRMIRKRRFNYFRQMKVMYRYLSAAGLWPPNERRSEHGQ